MEKRYLFSQSKLLKMLEGTQSKDLSKAACGRFGGKIVSELGMTWATYASIIISLLIDLTIENPMRLRANPLTLYRIVADFFHTSPATVEAYAQEFVQACMNCGNKKFLFDTILNSRAHLKYDLIISVPTVKEFLLYVEKYYVFDHMPYGQRILNALGLEYSPSHDLLIAAINFTVQNPYCLKNTITNLYAPIAGKYGISIHTVKNLILQSVRQCLKTNNQPFLAELLGRKTEGVTVNRFLAHVSQFIYSANDAFGAEKCLADLGVPVSTRFVYLLAAISQDPYQDLSEFRYRYVCMKIAEVYRKSVDYVEKRIELALIE